MRLTAEKVKFIRESLRALPPERRYLIQFLHQVQTELGYVPEEALKEAASYYSLNPSEIFGLLTFYSAFSLEPHCRHEIVVCQGTACHVRGSSSIQAEFSRLLGIRAGEDNYEKDISLKSVNCLGCCAIGPVVVVDGEIKAKVDLKQVEKIVRQITSEKAKNENK